MNVYEYRITAARRYGRTNREDVTGAGGPFRTDEPMWENHLYGQWRGAFALALECRDEAIAEGREDVRIERRIVGAWTEVRA